MYNDIENGCSFWILKSNGLREFLQNVQEKIDEDKIKVLREEDRHQKQIKILQSEQAWKEEVESAKKSELKQ